ncbi:MAG: response regulator transcription factor [Fimbriimonadaceae bacterium]|nr:response regulator transcription factor [Chitinophagales bacterium]
MLKVVILEDEKIAADYLEKQIHEYDATIQVLKKIDSVRNAITWLSGNTADLLFVDIHLADDVSFKIFEQVEIKIPLIFTTAYDQYAIKAFKLNSIDYLLKPIDKKELFAALDKFKTVRNNTPVDIQSLLQHFNQQRSNYQERFLVSTGQKLRSIPVNDIAYFFAEQKVVFLADKDGKQFIVDQSLDKLEPQLDPAKFFRINRQFIVAYSSIKNMLAYSKSRVKLELIPHTDKETIVSVERSGDFKEWLNK